MISIKGHIRILRDGKEPLDLTEYSQNGFPELTYNSWEAFLEDMKRRERDASTTDEYGELNLHR